jgi:very-short-patch-repair endonuclease
VCKVCTKPFRWSPSRTAGGAYNITYCSLACRDKDPAFRARLIAAQASWQRGRITSAEVAGYALLDSLGIEYEPQAIFKGKFTPDATIPSAQLIVQFDGDYWHDRKGTSTEARIRRRVALDLSQDAYIRACGWQVVRLWATDLKNDAEGCAEKVRQHLRLPS